MFGLFTVLTETTGSWIEKPEIWIPIIVSILSLLGLGTLTSLFWKDGYEKRKEKKEANTEAAKARAKQARLAEIREATEECWNRIDARLEVIETEIKKTNQFCADTSEATVAGLRNDILNVYYGCAKKGYRSKNDSENFWDLYKPYHKLGGNSFIDADVVKWFEELPSKEVYINEHKGEE